MRFNKVDLPHPDLPRTLTRPVDGKAKVMSFKTYFFSFLSTGYDFEICLSTNRDIKKLPLLNK